MTTWRIIQKMDASQWVGYMQSGGIVLTQAQYAALDRGE